MLEADTVRSLGVETPPELFGRRQIFTNETEITRDNVLKVLAEAIPVHMRNRQEEKYLEWYVRGRQPIRNRPVQASSCPGPGAKRQPASGS